MKEDGERDVGLVQVVNQVADIAMASAEKEFELVREMNVTVCKILNICG